MNVLSEVFKAVKLGVIMFYNAELWRPGTRPLRGCSLRIFRGLEA